MALVFRAEDERTGRIVALKCARAPREGLLASIRRETSVLERLQHPGVIRVLDAGVSEGVPWYAMDLLEGGTLQSLWRARQTSEIRPTAMRSQPANLRGTAETELNTQDPWVAGLASAGADDAPPLPPDPTVTGIPWFLTLVRRLCEPLAYVHGEGVVHRDLSPGNVFVLPDGAPVLMDFGLGWRLEGEGRRGVLSVDATRAGTVGYMAPEQARGDVLDARSDLFSLGCIMYEALTGRVPFPARSLAELVARHAEGPPRPPEQDDGTGRLLVELIMGLIELDPRDRIGHASSVAAILADIGASGWPERIAVQPKAYLYRPRLVGRHGPVKYVLGEIHRLGERRGGCLLVGGESGIGKTSLVSESARQASLAGIRVITCECAAVGVAGGRAVRRGGPLYPLASFLQAVADRCVAGGPDVTAALLGARGKVLATVEASLKDLPGVSHYPEPADVPGEAARRRLIEALADTLAALSAEQPTLLVIEDLQWADDVTLALLASLPEAYYSANAVLVVGTYRVEETEADLERVVRLPHVKRLRLERLDAEAIGAMASEMLAQRAVPERLAKFLTTESSGNPFFVSEYLRAAVEAELLFRDGRGRWQETEGTSPIEGLGLPSTLKDVVLQRLARLPENSRRIVEAAGVLGKDVELRHLSVLSLTTGIVKDEPEFEEALRVLMTRHVLEASSTESVRFSHDKVREVAYQRLAPERALHLHAACASLLERHHGDEGTLERSFAVLAHHFEKAGALERARGYYDRAGEAAHALHANQESLRLLSRAATLDAQLGDPTPLVDRARRQRMLGLNSLALGDLKGAFYGLTEAMRIAGRPWPRSRPELMLRCVTSLGRELGRRWIPELRPKAPLGLDERELLLEAARAYERLFAVNYFNADMAGVTMSGLTNMALAERAGGATGELALGYATFGAMCSLSLLDGPARSYCHRALTAARDSGDEVAETWVLMNVAVVHLQAARWAETEDSLERVRTMSRKLGFSRRWEEATTQFSTARLLAGRFDDAGRLNDELLAAIERADPQTQCWAIVRQAELYLLRGDAGAALEAARAGERVCSAGLQRGEWVYALGPLALSLLRSGDARGAEEAAARCAEWIDKGSAPLFYNVFAYAAVVEVYFALWSRARGSARRTLGAAARRSVKRLRSIARAMPIAAPRAELWRGIEAVHFGKKSDAARHFERSAMRAAQIGTRYDEGLALAALGEHADDGAEARRALGAARSIFDAVGATYDLARVGALIGASS